MAKFNNSRYVTRGISTTVPQNIQIALWSTIDKLAVSGKEVDYLQVFNLETKVFDGKQHLLITHSQEVPEYKESYVVENFAVELNCKVFVIDDEIHSTMLLSSEY